MVKTLHMEGSSDTLRSMDKLNGRNLMEKYGGGQYSPGKSTFRQSQQDSEKKHLFGSVKKTTHSPGENDMGIIAQGAKLYKSSLNKLQKEKYKKLKTEDAIHLSMKKAEHKSAKKQIAIKHRKAKSKKNNQNEWNSDIQPILITMQKEKKEELRDLKEGMDTMKEMSPVMTSQRQDLTIHTTPHEHISLVVSPATIYESPTPSPSRKPIMNINRNSAENSSGNEAIPESNAQFETQSLLGVHSNQKLGQRYSGHISGKKLQNSL